MRSSDRRIAAARKIDQDVPKGRDTWPSPPPSSSSSADDTDRHDTIPTPAPDPVGTEAVVIPPLRSVNVEDRA